MDIDVVENLNRECILGLDQLDLTKALIDSWRRQLIARLQLQMEQCIMTVWARPLYRLPTEKQVNRMAKDPDNQKKEIEDVLHEPEIPYEYRDYKNVFIYDKIRNTLLKR